MSHTSTMTQINNIILRRVRWDDEEYGLWFNTLNPDLGGHSPKQLVWEGREKELLQYLKSQ